MLPRLASARRTSALAAALSVALTTALVLTGPLAPARGEPAPVGADGADGDALWLVTLDGPGLAGRGEVADAAARAEDRRGLRAGQDLTLEALDEAGSPEPVYRWTTALNGYAVRLDAAEAARLARVPGVASVERDSLRRLAGTRGGAGVPGPPVPGSDGGEGVVVGVVDSGLAPAGPVFAPLSGSGRPGPGGFRGECVAGPGWPASACSSKVVGSRWFVEGFGEDRLRATSRLSPRDDLGHGTQVASVVAGNAGVTVRVAGRDVGRYRGVAPEAGLAVYKACWAAPDPADDGCSTADLVTAVDRAVDDGVDVLTLAVGAGGPSDGGALADALLGAAEADVAVVAAGGNAGPDATPAHPSPWVTTVGAVRSPQRAGTVDLAGGPDLVGAMVSRSAVGPARLLRGGDAAAPGSAPADAAICRPGSLDAALVAGAVVVCERGTIGRVEKSRAIARADGVGMVLVQDDAAELTTDFHSVPTVHLGADAGMRLDRWAATHPDARVTLRPRAEDLGVSRVVPSAPTGGTTADAVKPDLVAPGTGVLGAVPAADGQRWDFFSGSSAAAATVAGVVAAVRAQHPGWSAPRVRSAVTTSSVPLRSSSVARQGAGQVRPGAAERPGLVLDVAPDAWRADQGDANTSSVVLPGGGSATRTLTRVGGRALYFSSSVRGFGDRDVTVTPAAVRLAPGERARFTVTVRGPRVPDRGTVVWRGADGTRVRVPVAVGGR